MDQLVQPGQTQPPSARTWNRMVQMLAWWDRMVATGKSEPPRHSPMPTDTIQVRNDCGYDRAVYDCLKVGTHQFTDPDQYERLMRGDAVAAAMDAVCVLQEPIPSGGCGLAQVSGCCWAYVDVDATSGLDHPRAIPAAADYQLQSSFAGPHKILWQPGTTGKQLCLIEMWAPSNPLYALTGASGISAATIAGSGDTTTITPASAACSLFYWDPANSRWAILKRSGSAVPVTIYNSWSEPIGADAVVKVSAAEDGKLTVDSELCGV